MKTLNIPLTRPSLLAAAATLALGALAPVRGATLVELDELTRPPTTGANTFLLGVNNTPPVTWTTDTGTATFTARSGYLVVYFDTVSLANIGDSVSFNYTAKFINFDITNNGLRLGLLNNDANTQITADSTNTNISDADDYTGYIGMFRVGSSAASGSIVRRINEGTAQLLGGAAITGAKSLATDLPGAGYTDPAVSHTGSFSVTRTGLNEVTISNQFGSATIESGIDTGTGLVTQFNTLAIFATRAGATDQAASIEFSQFEITTIPEPGSVALTLGGFGAAALAMVRRKRR